MPETVFVGKVTSSYLFVFLEDFEVLIVFVKVVNQVNNKNVQDGSTVLNKK